MTVDPLDERPHEPTADPRWVEAWLFDVVQQDGSLAMSIECLLWPQFNRVAFHASVVQRGRPLISLVELEASAPKPPSLEVRASGLWTDIGIQTALDHMTVDIEAFAVELDDPNEVFAGGYGIRTALGCELEWETAAEVQPGVSASSYEIPCIVHGELLLDEKSIEIDGWGWRSHRWGTPGPGDRSRVRGKSADGNWFRDQGEERELMMQIVGTAPSPEPALDARLQQYFAHNDQGDLAWVRRVDF